MRERLEGEGEAAKSRNKGGQRRPLRALPARPPSATSPRALPARPPGAPSPRAIPASLPRAPSARTSSSNHPRAGTKEDRGRPFGPPHSDLPSYRQQCIDEADTLRVQLATRTWRLRSQDADITVVVDSSAAEGVLQKGMSGSATLCCLLSADLTLTHHLRNNTISISP